jgi:hypothetical protein
VADVEEEKEDVVEVVEEWAGDEEADGDGLAGQLVRFFPVSPSKSLCMVS